MSDRLTVWGNRGSRLLAVVFAVVMVTSLVAAAPVASAASETEPNDSRETAQSISVGETITGSTPTEDDEDWFAFTAQRGETINVTMSVASGTKSPDKVRLRKKNGDKIVGTRVSAGETGSVGTTATYTGTYYVQVVYDFGNPSDYSFSVDTYATDGFEPNEDLANATRISTNTSQSGQTTIGDTDWFRFEAERGKVINATMTVAACDAKCPDKIKLYRKNGDKLGNAQTRVSAGETGSTGTIAPYTGTYYVEVSYDFGSPSEYNFTVATYATDAFEPNQEFANATRIPTNTTQSGETTIGDTDWFRFEAEAGETINATMTVAASDTKSPDKIKLFKKNGDKLGNAQTRVSAGETESIGTTATYTGTYYVEVSYDFGSPSEYNFTVDTYRTDPFEPNENRSLATQLYDNPFTPAEALVSIGDNDYFKYRLETDETLRVEAGVDPAVRNHRLWLYRPGDDRDDPTNATEIDGGTIGVAELTAQSTGVHHLVIWGGRGGDTGPYNVTITAGGETVGPPNDRFETANPPIGNQNRQAATPIESGRYGNLGMVDDDEDWFRFRAAQDARVTVNTSYNSSANDLAVEMVAPDGTTIQPSGDDDSLAVNVSAAGTYYLRVTGQPDAQATYALVLNVSAAGPGALPGQAQAPTDVDGDGRYEDVNGDGGLNVIDVSILLSSFDRIPAGEVPFYDFNDDGQVNILDVAALLDDT